MSLILDALRKSDRQRSRRATEQLRWGPGPARHPGSHPRPGVIMLLVAVIAMTVATSAWLGTYLATTPAAEQHEQSTGQTGQLQRPAIRDLKGELATRPAVSVATSDGPAVPATRRQSNGPADDEKQAFDNILTAPGLSEMPADYRIRVPQLEINVHAWTEEPSARFVLINMRRYSEGERLQEGPLLRQITPDGVVLEFENELFTLPQR